MIRPAQIDGLSHHINLDLFLYNQATYSGGSGFINFRTALHFHNLLTG